MTFLPVFAREPLTKFPEALFTSDILSARETVV